MKTLQSKIFIFTLILLILPALPLSIFVKQLLDKSFQIGVNEKVESALDNALDISSDFYQFHKKRLQDELDRLIKSNKYPGDLFVHQIKKNFPEVLVQYIPINASTLHETLISVSARKRFLKERKTIEVWPAPDHSNLYALARTKDEQLVEIVYPMPVSFRKGAAHIQQVGQIYKTLAFVRDDIQKSFLFTFLIIYASGIMIALGVTWFISRKITKPIEMLNTATTEIGKGNLNHRISIKSNDEFGLLASAFNRMVEELEENQRRIIDLEKMATWQQLARKLAHEIKNPLTPIQLVAQQMRDKYDGENNSYRKLLDECCDIVEEEVGSLQKLVREFSDFARLPQFQPIEQNISQLIQSIQKLYGHKKIQIDLPAGPVTFAFDNDYMKRALINLVDNALAATESGKPVRLVFTNLEESQIEVMVSDQGQGIEPKYLDKIFEPYFSTKRSGVGLGLAIVKKIIEEHGGKIEVTSIVHQGTNIKIILPVYNSDHK